MRQPSKNTLLKVVILGDGGVGKSCLMNRFVSNHFDEHSFHTIGVEFLNKDIEINGEMYTLQVSTAEDIINHVSEFLKYKLDALISFVHHVIFVCMRVSSYRATNIVY